MCGMVWCGKEEVRLYACTCTLLSGAVCGDKSGVASVWVFIYTGEDVCVGLGVGMDVFIGIKRKSIM